MVKRALIIGINYTGTPSQLHGCVNDAENMHAFLQGQGYTEFKMWQELAQHGYPQVPQLTASSHLDLNAPVGL